MSDVPASSESKPNRANDPARKVDRQRFKPISEFSDPSSRLAAMRDNPNNAGIPPFPEETFNMLRSMFHEGDILEKNEGSAAAGTKYQAYSDAAQPDRKPNLKKPTTDQDMNILLHVLDDREKDIVMSRFGVKRGQDQTLEEMSEKHGVSKDTVRKIEAGAMKKVQSHAQKYPDCTDPHNCPGI